ncbi:hypothetical protein KAFR_0E04050 [Kazachstania africana CBS 2517]|uniref:Sbe2/Sbe22 C-terminal domain-containing protein n=1 Tax=Kazachstania africana (strain ATCC 22294 / BCRC 22015 / CBS 2517 / CECT 1963 / NBRC 1671 / NRRL Y-8276) TaxID=1071382 RepID=H2AW06_KAZAF|nr:hypothetical protein KAFR_0E04050 [Kazachstania africana CBS 2517]CCF58556.1 hypothetical protein KAFR_0E04050 [Kazachstania africana CBS 2517]
MYSYGDNGLIGLGIITRRPSDNLLNKIRYKDDRKREISDSNISIISGASTVTNRRSLSTSTTSSSNSVVIDNKYCTQNRTGDSNKTVIDNRNNATDKGALTPSQKYRLHKFGRQDKLRKQIINNDSLFDGWNVPVYSYLGEESLDLPVTPIPGMQAFNSDTSFMSSVSSNLSEVNVRKFRARRPAKRLVSNGSITSLGDASLTSRDKSDVLCEGRPNWLPPLESCERAKTERMINKTFESMFQVELNRNSRRWELLNRNRLNWERYMNTLHEDNLHKLRKLVWDASINQDLRLSCYSRLFKRTTDIKIESYNELVTKLLQIEFPASKQLEIDRTVQENIKSKISFREYNGSGKIFNDLQQLLQIKSISKRGLLQGDELLFFHFLQMKYQMSDIWNIVNMIQSNCFHENVQFKFGNNTYNLNFFKLESEPIDFKMFWNIMERLNHDLFLWVVDIIVITNMLQNKWNYKILLSFVINILTNYHFGFNDLVELHTLTDSNFILPAHPLDSSDAFDINHNFVKKWSRFYEKM